MAIASPFLGVKGQTYIPLPRFIEYLIASSMGQTGVDLFGIDESNPLVYKMCTDDEFLNPLREFKNRRLYGALSNDAMVPLSVSNNY